MGSRQANGFRFTVGISTMCRDGSGGPRSSCSAYPEISPFAGWYWKHVCRAIFYRGRLSGVFLSPFPMVHPHTELRFVSPSIGWGVFATRPIPRGTITWALDALDQKFTPAERAALPEYAEAQLEKYSYADAHGNHVLCWDHARFFNHSCAANCLSVGYDFELAVRDIAAGEELTDDYGTLNPTEPFSCLCGATACRGEVRPDDHLRQGVHWNNLARDAFFLIPTVPQPLWEIIAERPIVEAALADPNRLRPIQHHFGPRVQRVPARTGV